MLECGFESRLGLEFSGPLVCGISKTRRQGFPLGMTVSSPPSSGNKFPDEVNSAELPPLCQAVWSVRHTYMHTENTQT